MPSQLVVEDMPIPTLGITLVDASTINRRTQTVSRQVMYAALMEQLLRVIRPGQELCENDQPSYEVGAYEEAFKAEPELTFAEFRDRNGGALVRDDSEANPDLQTLNLVAIDRDRLILGSFVLYNIEVERDEVSKITVSAMPMPGTVAAPGFSRRDTWNEIMRWILERDLPITTGQVLDVVEWRFPTRSGHQWVITPEQMEAVGLDNVIASVPGVLEVAGLGDHDIEEVGGVPIRVRRKPTTAGA